MNTDKIYAEALANEYAPKDTSKVVALKKLDQRVKLPAEILAYTLGIAAALLMGAGMCISMGVIGAGNGQLYGGGRYNRCYRSFWNGHQLSYLHKSA